jgi:hypothetical protein
MAALLNVFVLDRASHSAGDSSDKRRVGILAGYHRVRRDQRSGPNSGTCRYAHVGGQPTASSDHDVPGADLTEAERARHPSVIRRGQDTIRAEKHLIFYQNPASSHPPASIGDIHVTADRDRGRVVKADMTPEAEILTAPAEEWSRQQTAKSQKQDIVREPSREQ